MLQTKPTSIWDNPETCETVRRMWVDEMRSYNEIADVISATRSQVSGYVSRAGLPRRVPKLFSTRVKSPPRPTRPPVDRMVRILKTAAVDAERTEYDANPALDASGSPYMTLTILGGMCRYIAGEPSAQAPMCGHTVHTGSKYCEEHHRRTHVPMHIHTRQGR